MAKGKLQKAKGKSGFFPQVERVGEERKSVAVISYQLLVFSQPPFQFVRLADELRPSRGSYLESEISNLRFLGGERERSDPAIPLPSPARAGGKG
jgi:hypothetical protein